MAHEGVFEFPKEHSDGTLAHILQANFNECLQSRTLQMPTLGRGRAGVVKKTFKYVNLIRMESSSTEAFARRCS